MSESEILLSFADALDAAAKVLRTRAGSLTELVPREPAAAGAVDRARTLRPSLGPRQAEVIEVLERHGAAGVSTSVISRAIQYSQSNVHLTLMGLMDAGLVERDDDTRPHMYRLSAELRGAQ